ncbi:MAG: hypothetical protein JWP95_486 [Actinotalea sp.]|nr:hypothetical protein [Actinotalea sp.]
MGDTTTHAAGASAPVGAGVPARADGLVLIGEMAGSGYRVAPSLVRRGDGQTLQLTRLLYLLLEVIDGTRDREEIATAVSTAYGRRLSSDDVVTLEAELTTLGLLRLPDGSQPTADRSNPLLALRWRYTVSDPTVTRRITAPFAVLFHPVVVLVMLTAFVAVCAWVLLEKGLASATHQAFDRPDLLLGVFALTVISAGFHEFGHAAAARYGGATPGVMGTGLYLVWPAFYTDVTDSYRLGRAGRVRTDLGGLYFNALVAVAIFGVWALTSWDALLIVIATQVLQMVRQLAPLVRFDGYHVLADLTGVPDLYQRIGPTLRSLLPWRRHDPEAAVLKPWARAVVTVWVLLVVPLLVLCLVVMVLALPRILGTAWAGLVRQWSMLTEQMADGDLLGVAVRVLSLVAIALPVLGIAYILVRLVRQAGAAVRRRTAGSRGRQGVALVAALALLGGVASAWWPDADRYRPVEAYERGTLADLAPAGTLSSGRLEEGRPAQTTAVWPQDASRPTVEHPELAVVLVPRTEGGAAAAEPAWVFPFNRPAPPDEGDNQALAVNTADGSTVYDVAFALVWVTDGEATERNEAYALASCTGCTTVAVAFQVVLLVGQTDTVVPENLAAAVNYSCVACVTYALATQLVVTLDEGLGEASMAELAALTEELAAFGESIEDVPLSQLQARLTEFERRILAIIEADPAVTDAPPAEPTAGPTAEPTVRPTTAPTEGSAPGTPAPTQPAPVEGGGEDGDPEPGPTDPAGSTEPVPTAEPEPTTGTPTQEPAPSPTVSPAP